MDIDITDLVRDYLIRFLTWLEPEAHSANVEGAVDEFLKEDQ